MTQNIMQQALGAQWALLPTALKEHYQTSPNKDIGTLDVEYPMWMQPYLHVLRLVGALVNRQGKAIPTTVEKHFQNDIQYWRRTLSFPNGKTVIFKSRWQYNGENQLIEYVNPVMGLCMAVNVKNEKLYYEGICYVVKFGKWKLKLPEWLILGHTTIVETVEADNTFSMDFRLRHPLFGQLFRYAGRFGTERIGM